MNQGAHWKHTDWVLARDLPSLSHASARPGRPANRRQQLAVQQHTHLLSHSNLARWETRNLRSIAEAFPILRTPPHQPYPIIANPLLPRHNHDS
jgi:hypothetical protein